MGPVSSPRPLARYTQFVFGSCAGWKELATCGRLDSGRCRTTCSSCRVLWLRASTQDFLWCWRLGSAAWLGGPRREPGADTVGLPAQLWLLRGTSLGKSLLSQEINPTAAPNGLLHPWPPGKLMPSWDVSREVVGTVQGTAILVWSAACSSGRLRAHVKKKRIPSGTGAEKGCAEDEGTHDPVSQEGPE